MSNIKFKDIEGQGYEIDADHIDNIQKMYYNGTNYTNNSNNQSQAPDPFAGSGDTIDITDDDLPF